MVAADERASAIDPPIKVLMGMTACVWPFDRDLLRLWPLLERLTLEDFMRVGACIESKTDDDSVPCLAAFN